MARRQSRKRSSATSSGSENGLPISTTIKKERTNRKVWVGRLVFVFFLCVAAACMGVITFRLLDHAAVTLAETKFDSIADRAFDTAKQTTFQKHMGAVTAAKLAANAHPDASAWPFVTVRGFEAIVGDLIQASSGRNMALCPFVTPDQLETFEAFAYNYFYEERDPPFPNRTATSSFGRGVWGRDPSLNTTDQRYHVSDGSTSYNSPNRIFAPVIQHDNGAHVTLLMDVHYQETRGKIIDEMIACSGQRKVSGEKDTDCGAITDFLILTSQSVRPGALLMQPIYPEDSPLELTGFIASSLIWDEVIANAFTSSDDGIDCVLSSSGGGQYTYSVHNGKVELRGEGNLHFDSSHDDYCVVIDLATRDDFGETSTAYTMEICPTEEFFDTYRTKNPMFATIGAVCIVVVSTILFLGYDSCVRGEFQERKSLLEAKRNFVRFVSHEVRTPLSSVCMGLSLIKTDMEQSTPLLLRDGENFHQSLSEDDAIVVAWYEQIQEVLDNAKNSVDVLNDLLQYDKIEVGAVKLELAIVPVWSLVEKTFKEFMLAADAKKLQFSLRFHDPSRNGDEERPLQKADDLSLDALAAMSIADVFRLTQVLRNLISNAIKFTEHEGSVQVAATYIAVRSPVRQETIVLHDGQELDVDRAGRLSFAVTDSGAGMTPEQVSQIFHQNIQFNANELQHGQGSGLGLYIAAGIAEQHGGSLVASSPGLGKGSTFTFSLPLFRLPEGEEKVPGHSLANETVQDDHTSQLEDLTISPAHPLRVLVVDDAKTNRRLLLRWLRNQGHLCDEACDGVEALSMVMASTEAYDVLLVDYEMPRLSGPDAVQKIRDFGCDSLVIGISGNVLPEDIQWFKKCGANTVLPKPLQFADLDSLLCGNTFPQRTGDTAS